MISTPILLRRSVCLFTIVSLCLGVESRAQAQSYNYTNTTSGTDTWNTTTADWLGGTLPVSGAGTSVIYDSGKTFTGGAAITINSQDNIATGTTVGAYSNVFQMNNLTLAGTTAATTPTTINISGNALDFVTSGSNAPTITLGGKSTNSSTSLLTYNVLNNLILTNNVTVGVGAGAGTTTTQAYYNFDGALSGTGNLTMNATGEVMSLNTQNAFTGTNNGYQYSGSLSVTAGELIGTSSMSTGTLTGSSSNQLSGNDYFTTGSLTVGSGATFDVGGSNFAVSSLTGSGTIYGSAATGILAVNYVGSGTDTFTGAFNFTNVGGNKNMVNIRLNGDGILTIPTLTPSSGAAAGSLYLDGSGLVSTPAVNSSLTMGTPNGVLEVTGTSGSALGSSVGTSYGGTIFINPTSGSSNVAVQQTGGLRLSGGTTTIELNANGNTSVTLIEGSGTATAAVLNNNGATTAASPAYPSSLTIVPTAGLSALGSTDNFIVEAVAGDNATPTNTNGLAGEAIGMGGTSPYSTGPTVFAASPTGNGTADFTSYIGNGSSNDTGFVTATTAGAYTLTNTLSGSTSTSVVDINSSGSPITVGNATSAYAMRITGSVDSNTPGATAGVLPGSSANVTVSSGQTLTIGDGVAKNVAGLVLNGGVIGGSGTLATGDGQIEVYTDLANGVISTAINDTATGITNTEDLVKTGPGTLFLTNTSATPTHGVGLVVDQGALDVGLITIPTGSPTASKEFGGTQSDAITLYGGVLEGNGTYINALNGLTPNGSGNTAGSSGGGFAAYGGTLNVTGAGAATGVGSLTWGANTATVTGTGTLTETYSESSTAVTFLPDADGSGSSDELFAKELLFGSNVSNSQVNFSANIALGLTTSSYYRDINVNLGTGTDTALLSGIITDSPNVTATDSLATDGITSYTIQGAGAHGILKDGPGTLITSGNNTYNGLTQVNNGSLFVNGTNGATNGGASGAIVGQGSYTVSPLAATSALTTSGSTTSNTTSAQYNYYNTSTGLQTTAKGALLGGTGTIGLAANQNVTVTGVGATELAHLEPGVATSVGAPSTAGTLTIGTVSNGNSVNLGAYSSFDINLSGTSATELAVNGNVVLNTNTAALGGTLLTLDLVGAPTGTGLYDILNYTGSLSGFFNNDASTITVGSDTFNILYNSGQVDLQLVVPTPTAAYFNGVANDLNTATDYDTSASSATAVGGVPAGTTNVFFSANRNGSTTPNISSPLIVNSVNFGAGTSGVQSGITVSSSNTSDTLTIMASNSNGNTSGSGITIATGGGNDTISAPVVLGADQSWTPTDATSVLTVSGQVSGSHMLTKAGAGSVVLSNATGNIYTGGTTVSAGKLYVNGGVSGSSSGTGSGAVTVNGGTLAGKGNITTSAGVTINTGGTLASGDAQSGTSVDSTHLTVTNTSISIASANLTFDLGAGNTVGSGYHTFGTPNTNTTSLTLSGTSTLNFTGTDSISIVDLTGGALLSLRQGTPYLLVAALSGLDSAYTGLVTSLDGTTDDLVLDGNGFVMGVGTLSSYTPISINQFGPNGVTQLSGANIYAAPVLYLYNGDLEIVPEPGTWALMIGGLALLVVIQRRKNRMD